LASSVFDFLEKKGITGLLRPPDPTLNIHKRQLEQIISGVVKKQGKILDLGSGGRRLGKTIINLDIQADENLDIMGDAHLLPFKEQVFDLIICTALLEHVPRPQKVVEEILRCLNINGIVYVQVPFLQGYHSDPHDYYRFTIEGIEEIFHKFRMIDKGVCIGPISVLVWYLRKFPTIFFTNKFINKGIEFFTGWLFFIFRYLDIIFVKTKNAYSLAGGIFFIGKKDSSMDNY
jgi:SAM-dependent methyltransferase